MKVKRSLAILSIVLLAFLLIGCPGDNSNTNPVTEAQITGVVHFPTISYQQKVVVYLDESKSVVTDSNGTFSFQEVSLGIHTLRVDSALYGSQIYQIDLAKDGAVVDLNAYLTRVHTTVSDDQRVHLQVEPAFPATAAKVQIGLSEQLSAGFQELGVVGPGSFVQEITDLTQAEKTYYLRLTYLDQNNNPTQEIYTRFSYQPPIELIIPTDGETVTVGDFFNWSQLPNATYQLSISASDSSYQEKTGLLFNSGYVLGEEFDLAHQTTYQWQVTAFVTEEMTDWVVNEVHSQERSFIYSDGSVRAEISGTVHFPATGTGTVTVVYLDEEESVVTNVDGSFTFFDVPVGLHTLRVDSALYGSDYVEVNLTSTGAAVDLNAVHTSVLTVVDPTWVRIIANPEFTNDVTSIRVEFSENLTDSYQVWDTIPKGDMYVKGITNITQPDQKYYLRFTYLDQTGTALKEAYNCFYYYSVPAIFEPADNVVVADQTLFRWEGISDAEYQVRITAIDFSYSNVSNFLTLPEMILSNEFNLTNQTYNWEVTAYLLDGTDNFIQDVRLKLRSAERSFTYQP